MLHPSHLRDPKTAADLSGELFLNFGMTGNRLDHPGSGIAPERMTVALTLEVAAFPPEMAQKRSRFIGRLPRPGQRPPEGRAVHLRDDPRE